MTKRSDSDQTPSLFLLFLHKPGFTYFVTNDIFLQSHLDKTFIVIELCKTKSSGTCISFPILFLKWFKMVLNIKDDIANHLELNTYRKCSVCFIHKWSANILRLLIFCCLSFCLPTSSRLVIQSSYNVRENSFIPF